MGSSFFERFNELTKRNDHFRADDVIENVSSSVACVRNFQTLIASFSFPHGPRVTDICVTWLVLLHHFIVRERSSRCKMPEAIANHRHRREDVKWCVFLTAEGLVSIEIEERGNTL